MDEMRRQDTAYLRDDQYRDARHLNARAQLHRLFSQNPADWHGWVFAASGLTADEHVLECGCGPGWLWRENVARIPSGCVLTLTDLSPGMVAEAEAALAPTGHDFRFRPADIQALPFAADSFDVVVANHMLYHVPDREKALAEVVRVLRPGGRFLAATNGEAHMRELVALRALAFAADDPLPVSMSLPFTLQNGRAQLESWFDDVTLLLYDDWLQVTAVEPLLAYLLSASDAAAYLTPEKQTAVARHVQTIIDHDGFFHITKETGLFIARLAPA